MSGIDDLLDGIPIPRMARAAQRFDRPQVSDVEVSENLLETVRAHPDMSVLSGPEDLVFDRDGNLF